MLPAALFPVVVTCDDLASGTTATSPALSDLRQIDAEGEELMSQALPSWNQLWGWLRELEELRRAPAEEGGFATAGGF